MTQIILGFWSQWIKLGKVHVTSGSLQTGLFSFLKIKFKSDLGEKKSISEWVQHFRCEDTNADDH